MAFSYTILLRRPEDKMPYFYEVENFYPLAMAISQVIPVLKKILTGKVAFAQQMPTILYSAFIFKEVSVMHGSILPVTIDPPPQDKSGPSGPGVGNCLKRSCSGGSGAGQIANNFSLFLVRHVTCQLTQWRRTAWRRLPISRENL